jgi:predicted PurR-regulated permease PerM
MLVVAVLGFLYLVRGVLLPFVVSFIVATLLDPAIRKLRLRGYSRPVSVGMVFGVFLLVITLLGVLITPSAVSQVDRLVGRIDDITATVSRNNQESNFYLRWNPVIQAERGGAVSQIDSILLPYRDQLERWNLPTTQKQIVDRYIEPRRGQIADAVQQGLNGFFGVLGGLASQLVFVFLIPIIAFMMLLDMENYRRRSPRWIPPSIRSQTISLMGEIGQVFSNYLRGMSTLILLYMVSSTILFWVLGVPYAILLGIVCGTLYMIPIIGNLVSLALIILVAGFSGPQAMWIPAPPSTWVYAGIVAAIFFGMGQIFDQFLSPRLVGSSVGLSVVVSMFVVLCGGALFGMVGMLLAFPVSGAVKVILDRVIKVTSAPVSSLDLPAVPIRHRVSANS